MSNNNGEKAVENLSTVDDDGVFTMYEEIVAEIATFKKRPPPDVKTLVFWMAHTLLPYARDIAHYTRENRKDIDMLIDTTPDTETVFEGTQFAQEDAPKFDLVLTYALGQAQATLAAASEAGMSPEDQAKLSVVISTAHECLGLLEERTVLDEGEEDDDDETDGDDDEEDPATAAQDVS